MSRESPTLDEFFGPGAEAAESEVYHLEGIFEEIVKEREYQETKWGTDFDDKNTVNDWAAYIASYTSKATLIGAAKSEQRTALLKVASLAVAALQTFDRNGGFAGRHFD